MNGKDASGLVGAFGLLALMLLGLTLIVRGLLTGLTGSARAVTAPVGFGRGALGRSVASLLSFAVAYKFFVGVYAERLSGFETMLGACVVVLIGMLLVPAVETLVSITALTLFLLENTAVFGGTALAWISTEGNLPNTSPPPRG